MAKRETHSCSICGEPPVSSRIIDDGAVVWHCPDHLDGEALELYHELCEEGWEAPPRKTIH